MNNNNVIKKEIKSELSGDKDFYSDEIINIIKDEKIANLEVIKGIRIQFVNEPSVPFKGEYLKKVQRTDGTLGDVISINTAKLDEAVKEYGLGKEGDSMASRRRQAAHNVLNH